MNRYVIVIPAKNRAFKLLCDDGDSMKLETMQKLVGGQIEPVHTLLEPEWARESGVDSILLLVNEEGRLKGLPENPRAEEMASYAAPAHAKLVGPAIVAAGRGEEIIGFAKPVADTICAEWL